MSAASPGPTPRSTLPDLRRNQLIEAAIESIAQHGLSGTTVAKVADGAGLSPGVVTFYFKSKEALLLATLQHVDDQSERIMSEARARAGDDPTRQLEAIVESNFDPAICSPPWVAVWNAFWGEACARRDYLDVCGSREDALEERVVALFERLAREGGRAGVKSATLGRAFSHLLSSLPEDMLGATEPFDFEAAKATCYDFLATVFPAEFSRRIDEAPDEIRVLDPAPKSDSEISTLATWTYHDPEFHELEKEYLFRRHWLLAGHVSEVANLGDYLTLDAVGERALVIRGRDGRLRGFHNVCRHRASRVVRGETGNCARAIVCPYHGWSYGLDGRLRAVPSERTFPGLDKNRIALPEVDVEEWMGLLFVRFSGDGPGVGEILRPFEDEARHYRIDEMKPIEERWSESMDVNWKLVVENGAEGYHVPLGHPGPQRLFGATYVDEPAIGDASRSLSTLFESPSRVWSERMYQKLLPEVDHLPEELRRAWVYYRLFPSAGIVLMPDRVDCYQSVPVGTQRVRFYGLRLGHEDDRRAMRAARFLSSRINRQVGLEDVDFCRWTDAGVESSSYRGGILSNLETGVRSFQERLRSAIPVAHLAEAPPPGRVAAVNEKMRRPRS